MNLVTLHHVGVAYDGYEALKNVDLTIAQDDFLGIIGPNGGGKTTLVKAILGTVPHTGEVVLAPELFRGKERLIGYMPQISNFDRTFPISVLEVVTLAVDGTPAGYRWLNILSNYLGFGLSPGVCLCLVYVMDRKKRMNRWFRAAVCCEACYLLFLALSIPAGLVFSVSADNVYSRGQYFYIYIILYFAAIVYLSVSTIVTAREFQNRSRALIYPLMIFLLIETIIQVTLPDLHVTWLCVTLLSVLYFIYCSEMWNQLDALTGLLNQNSYLNRTAEMRRNGGVLVVFDVDDFKQINDRYGHLQGDLCLAEIGRCIKKAYARSGYCYRTGGDEFCVLMENADREAQCAQEFVRQLEQRRKAVDFLPTVSFGSAPFLGEDVLAVKNRADREMYRYKKARKPDAAHCSPNHTLL